jgi:hypothetical protein
VQIVENVEQFHHKQPTGNAIKAPNISHKICKNFQKETFFLLKTHKFSVKKLKIKAKTSSVDDAALSIDI